MLLNLIMNYNVLLINPLSIHLNYVKKNSFDNEYLKSKKEDRTPKLKVLCTAVKEVLVTKLICNINTPHEQVVITINI